MTQGAAGTGTQGAVGSNGTTGSEYIAMTAVGFETLLTGSNASDAFVRVPDTFTALTQITSSLGNSTASEELAIEVMAIDDNNASTAIAIITHASGDITTFHTAALNFPGGVNYQAAGQRLCVKTITTPNSSNTVSSTGAKGLTLSFKFSI
jgi:hypothetical protein